MEIRKKEEQEEGDERQSEVFKRLGVNPLDAKKTRKFLASNDCYKIGPAIWFTKEGVAKLERVIDAPEIASRFVNARVFRVTPNRNFVAIEDPSKPGSLCPAIVPRNMQKRLMRKMARFEVITDGNGRKTYRHESLSLRAGG